MKAFPGRLGAALIHRRPDVAGQIKTVWGIPAVSLPARIDGDTALSERLFRGYAQARDRADGEPWQKVLEHLQFHFQHYCCERWPRLVATLDFWTQLWTSARPAAVLVSSLADAESQLPAAAAQRLGIPTFSLPHGALTGARRLEAVDFVLWELSLQRKMYERIGVPHKRLIPCRDLVTTEEYPSEAANVSADDGAWRVLALTTVTQFPSCLAPGHSSRAQLDALRALTDPPGDLAPELSLRFKCHPGWPQFEFFSALDGSARWQILKPISELTSALHESDLVLLVNNVGSTVVHAARAGKPIIFFWLDPLMGTPELHADLVAEAGVVARTSEEVWDRIRDFFTRSQVADALRAKSLAFSSRYLDSAPYPTVIQEVAARCGDSRRVVPRAIDKGAD